ncbi:MAG: hypothetical protein KIT83_18970 [Bryobacterales bacterium]|nr:hypothetical protein [Bryobacterales bacterium]
MAESDPFFLNRRDLLQGAMAIAVPLCCSTPVAPDRSIGYRGHTLLLRLDEIPELEKVGEARAVVDNARKLNLLVLHPGEELFVVLDRACTHGGAPCTYNHRRQSVRCTSLNHAEFDMKGTLLHGRSHGNLRTYPVRRVGSVLEIDLAVNA